jgi:hypothetical protein
MKNKILYVLITVSLVLSGIAIATVYGVMTAERDDSLPVTGYKLIIYESSGLSESDFSVSIYWGE